MLLKSSACGGRGGVAAGSGGIIRGTNVKGYMEGFALRFVMRFFGAGAEVGRIVPMRIALEMRVCLFPDRAWHGFAGGEKRGRRLVRSKSSAHIDSPNPKCLSPIDSVTLKYFTHPVGRAELPIVRLVCLAILKDEDEFMGIHSSTIEWHIYCQNLIIGAETRVRMTI